MIRGERWLVATLSLLLASPYLGAAEDSTEVRVGYLAWQPDPGPVLSNVLPEPADSGLQGAQLGIADNNATGRFLKQSYVFEPVRADSPEQLVSEAQALVGRGFNLLVVNTPEDALRQLSAAVGETALIFNAGSPADSLRQTDCPANVMHTLPSRAMLADALAQWLKVRRLEDWLLLKGQRPEDEAFAAAMKRSAQRFGMKIVEEKTFTFDTDLRRSTQTEMPPFTRSDDYDVVVVADESGDFGEYVPYNTWLPRPVVGTQGLTPVAWHRVVESWGAAQLQNRFTDQSGRWMNSEDYAAWAAVRAIGEAVAKGASPEPEAIQQALLSDEFGLGAHRGRPLTFRDWNRQLRQPIPLVHPRALVSQSPQEGFLHQVNELDTLGFDAPESQCQPLAEL